MDQKWTWDVTHIVLLVCFLLGAGAETYDRLHAGGPMTATAWVNVAVVIVFGLLNFFKTPPKDLVASFLSGMQAVLSGKPDPSTLDSGNKGDKN